MNLTVRYANFDDLPRVNELRRTVSELHAEGRPDILRPGLCEELRQRVYALFDAAPQHGVIVACLDGEICGFAIAQYVDRLESAYMCAQRSYASADFRTFRCDLECKM